MMSSSPMRSILDSTSSPSLSSLLSPPPPPPFLSPLHSSTTDSNSPSSSSYKPSFIIITSIIASVILASAVIHLLLRHLSHRHPSPPSSSTTTFNFFSPPRLLNPQPLSNDRKALIDSLPLFSLADSTVPRRSADCAVCLSRMAPHEELRLLPACAHVFHSPCIDTWLRSTSSCPLCRSSVHPPPPPQAVEQSASFRLELGSVSRRRPSDATTGAANVEEIQQQQSYSLGSSFEYRVEEEVEAVIASLRRSSAVKEEESGPSSPGQEAVEAAGEGSRGWLRDYVDRLASSASSSFSSLRFSGRWSHRFNGTGSEGGGGDAGPRQSWDLGEEGDYSASFYRWIRGVLS